MYRGLFRSAGLVVHLAVIHWLSLCHEAVGARHVVQRQTIQPAQGDLCYLYNHRSAILGNRLYFMGGQYTFQGGDTTTAEQKLYWLDLNTSFPVDTAIPSNVLRSIAAPADSQWTGTGAFFTSADQTGLYSFGGFLHDDSEHNSTWLFNSSTAQWSNLTVSGGNLNKGNRDSSMHISTTGTNQGLSFINGGWDSTSGMVVFNSDPHHLSWTNQTQNNTPGTMGSTMQYLRYGKAGILIAFGGYDTSHAGSEFSGWPWDNRPMNLIMIYDIDSTTWFNVTASGDIPTKRSEFCSAVSAAPDDSSFQITIYGGWSLLSNMAFEEVYVLSIPSFRWIKIDDQATNKEANLPGQVGRKDMTCQIRGDRQMLILGGGVNLGKNQMNGQTCNTSYPAIRLLDTTTLEWLDQYNRVAEPYGVPQVVYNIIGGSASGGAKMRQPSGGFNNTSLSQVFSHTVARYAATTSGPSSLMSSAISNPESSSSSTSSPSSSSQPPSPVGPAVGGAVGAVALLGTAAAAIYFCLRRRRRRQNRSSHQFEKPELSAQGQIRPEKQQRHELPSEPSEPLYELGGDYHGVEAHSEEAMFQR